MKACTKCKAEKDESEFPGDAKRKDGLYPQCKECVNLKGKSYYASLGKGSKKGRIRRQRELRAECRKSGRCTDCLSPAEPGNRCCKKCLAAHRELDRESYQRLKKDVFEHYGGFQCAGCGFTDPRCLSLDHVEDNGAEHRRQLQKQFGQTQLFVGRAIYAWLRKNNYPPGFQVLCMNCQWIKKFEAAKKLLKVA
jgi:hypothetical protein